MTSIHAEIPAETSRVVTRKDVLNVVVGRWPDRRAVGNLARPATGVREPSFPVMEALHAARARNLQLRARTSV